MNRNCNIAMIGTGGMAREHLKAFSDIPGVSFTGLLGRNKDKAEMLAAAYGIPVVASTVSELFERGKHDLVIVAASAPALADLIEQCCAYPWTVLAEKPVGLNLGRAELVLRKARENRARVFVALNRRFYSPTLAVLEGLKQDSSQRVIEVFDQEDQELFRSIGACEEEIAGLMFGNSIHTIDYFRIFGRGDVISVTPFFRWGNTAPLVTAASIKFSSGDLGIYRGYWNAPAPWAVTATTQSMRWELRPLEKASFQRRGSREQCTIETDHWDAAFKPGLRRQAEEAVKAALGLDSLAVTLEESHKTMRLIDQIYRKD